MYGGDRGRTFHFTVLATQAPAAQADFADAPTGLAEFSEFPMVSSRWLEFK
jgi:hypothetical protein